MNLPPTLEQTQGCLLGLALGDALGAPYEGGLLERMLWRLMGSTRRGEMRWTDDTQMSVDLVAAYLAEGAINPDDLAQRFARSYRWSRGYGPGAAKVLKRIAAGHDWRQANRSVFPQGSLGNGGAMRAALIGLIYASRPGELSDAVRKATVVTHAHPLGIDGAALIARAAASLVQGDASCTVIDAVTGALSQSAFVARLSRARNWLESAKDVSRSEVVARLGNGVAAHESCVTALYLALRFRSQPFLELQRFIASCGGDVDTIGAMAGALWGTANGGSSLPVDQLAKLEQRERLVSLATDLHLRIASQNAGPPAA